MSKIKSLRIQDKLLLLSKILIALNIILELFVIFAPFDNVFKIITTVVVSVLLFESGFTLRGGFLK